MPVSTTILRWLHGVAAAAHLGQAGALTGLVATKTGQEDAVWPITELGWEKVLTDKTRRYNLGWLLPVFPALSSFNHTVFAVNPKYLEQVLEQRYNPLRWGEFSASASVMTWLLATLSGVTELRSLISLVLANVAMQFLGLLIEKRKAEGAPRSELLTLTAIAWAIFATIWVQITMSFVSVLQSSTFQVPKIIYSIIVTMLSLFMSFGILQVCYVFDLMDYSSYEAGFIGLSLSAKSLLSWLVWGGILSGKQRFIKKEE